MTLSQKTTTGILWNFTELLSRRGIQTLITLLLAWFLQPDDFGLVAMMAVFLAIATNLMESGFRQALIRIKDASQLDFNTAFYANLGLGALSYAMLFLAAPFIADFYNKPRLIGLIRIAAIAVIINAFQVVQSAVLSRDLNFKAQLQASVPAGIVSGIVAVVLAYKGFGVWALIIQMLISALLITVMLWFIQGWRPTFGFSRQSLDRMYNFGYKLFLSGLLDTIFQNLYVIVIAKIFAAAIAGHYFFATKLRDLVIAQLVGAIQTVTYPALATIQNDDIRLKAGYRKIIGVTTFLLFPAMLMLAAMAEPLFVFLLPSKWLPAVSYLQLLCIAGVIYPLHAINLNVLMVKGRSDLFLHLEIIKKVMAVVILFISIQFGIIGILIGQIVTSVLAYIPNSYFSAKLINYTVREQITDFMPGLVLSGSVALVIYGAGYLIQWPAFAKLFILALMAGILYFAGAHLMKLQAYLMARQILMERIKQGGDKTIIKKHNGMENVV
jgi:O-antigen/teichoic acid export membrane protein